jgi:hypothetical protein
MYTTQAVPWNKIPLERWSNLFYKKFSAKITRDEYYIYCPLREIMYLELSQGIDHKLVGPYKPSKYINQEEKEDCDAEEKDKKVYDILLTPELFEYLKKAENICKDRVEENWSSYSKKALNFISSVKSNEDNDQNATPYLRTTLFVLGSQAANISQVYTNNEGLLRRRSSTWKCMTNRSEIMAWVKLYRVWFTGNEWGFCFVLREACVWSAPETQEQEPFEIDSILTTTRC